MKNKGLLIQHNERCKNCLYCSIACPAEAISVSSSVNNKGYNTMHVDSEKCIACGICYTVCPDYVFELVKEAQHAN